MTTSGTTTFNPSIADLFLEAFGRIGIMPPAVTRGHIRHARRSINYELIAFSNKGVNLWAVDQQTITLTQAATYVIDPATVTMLDTFYSIVNGGGPGVDIDRIMIPMSRTEYDETPNKLQQGQPTRYWFQKVIPRQVTIWQPAAPGLDSPNGVIKFHRLRRLQDASPEMGQTADIDALFLDALADALAVRFARKYAAERLAEAKEFAKESWDLAVSANREDVPITLQTRIQNYWPR